MLDNIKEVLEKCEVCENYTQTKAPLKSVVPVNSLPPLALDQTIFPPPHQKGPKTTAKPLNSLEDLAHTVDERFVLAYPADPPALVVPACKETLINLDCLLLWCCPLLKNYQEHPIK